MIYEVERSQASKTVPHEGADLILDALANGKPVEGVTDKRGDMGELRDAPYEMSLKINCKMPDEPFRIQQYRPSLYFSFLRKLMLKLCNG